MFLKKYIYPIINILPTFSILFHEIFLKMDFICTYFKINMHRCILESKIHLDSYSYVITLKMTAILSDTVLQWNYIIYHIQICKIPSSSYKFI